MNRITLLSSVSLVVASALAAAQPKAEPRDPNAARAVLEQLQAEHITHQLDVPYARTQNPRQRLDFYLPKQRKSERLPVIVFIHGGGWAQGDKSGALRHLMPFLRTGQYACVSVGYRLTGEATWPAQIHDCKAAIRWIRGNAARHGLDPDRIAVWGRSAGGHLALMLGFTGDTSEFDGDMGDFRGLSSKVAAVVNFFGPSDLTVIRRSNPLAPEALLIGGEIQKNLEKAKSASPITFISTGDAPVLTIHGTNDRTVAFDQAERLHLALRKAAVTSYVVTVKDGGHGDFGTVANPCVEAFLAKYLLDEASEVTSVTIENWKK